VLLWVGPFALLLVGGVALALNIRRRRVAAMHSADELSPEQRLRLQALLGTDKEIS
jgi:cytochrome c-type biogenesis protein CcmH